MRWEEVRAGARTVWGLLVSMALVATAFQIGTRAETPQPSPANNNLYLHYNLTHNQGWMDVDVTDPGDDGWSYHGAIFGFTGPFYVRFIMNPALNGSLCLMTEPTRSWTAHIGYYEGPGHFADVKGALTVGEYFCITGPESKDSFNFTFFPGVPVLRQETAIIFDLSFGLRGGDFIPNDLDILTGGNSTLAVPIVAVDSDGDGHNDTQDAFPSDPARWEKPKPVPEPARGFLPGFDALLAVVAFGIMAGGLVRRQRPWRRLR